MEAPVLDVEALGDQLCKRRFAVAVLAEERDPVVVIDPEVEIAQHGALRLVARGSAFETDERACKLLGGSREDERHDALFDLRGDWRHPRKRLDAALRLCSFRCLRPEPIDEGFDALAFVVLLLLELCLEALPLTPGRFEGIVAAGINRELAALEMKDRADRAVEQVAIVADDQDGVGVAAQIAFEPDRPFEVEIVGRLVEQQQLGLEKQDGGQGNPHTPATRIDPARLALRRFIETQTCENLRPHAPARHGPRYR